MISEIHRHLRTVRSFVPRTSSPSSIPASIHHSKGFIIGGISSGANFGGGCGAPLFMGLLVPALRAKGRSWVRVEDGRIQGTRVAWVARRAHGSWTNRILVDALRPMDFHEIIR